MATDYLVKAAQAELATPKLESKALLINFKWDDENLIVAKPQTYMNLSGESIGQLMRYYKVAPDHVLVLQDDLDQPFGQIKIKTKSGDGGHNGIKSLIEHMGTSEFPRIKIGVGRPTNAKIDVADYVLQNFSKEEQSKLPDVLNTTVDAIEAVIFDGVLKAMNKFNVKAKEE